MTTQNKFHHDIGLLLLKGLIAAAYISLLIIKPTGEGWGRGWNLVAYWIYVAPAILIIGCLHIWRQKVIGKKYSDMDKLMAGLAVIFPLVALAALKFKA